MADDAPAPLPPSTDTPPSNPPGRYEDVKGLIGDLARPVSLFLLGLSVDVATIVLACRISAEHLDGAGAALLLTAAGGTFLAAYGAKSAEEVFKKRAEATVGVAQAQNPTSTGS